MNHMDVKLWSRNSYSTVPLLDDDDDDYDGDCDGDDSDDSGGDDDNDEEHCRFKKTSFVPDFPFCELHRGPQGHVRTRQLHSVRRVEVCSFFFYISSFLFLFATSAFSTSLKW